MAITNTSKVAPSLSNLTRVSISELWSTITTTWASETRSWLDMISVMDNISRQTTSITNIAKP